jgi:hypothetical protein
MPLTRHRLEEIRRLAQSKVFSPEAAQKLNVPHGTISPSQKSAI